MGFFGKSSDEANKEREPKERLTGKLPVAAVAKAAAPAPAPPVAAPAPVATAPAPAGPARVAVRTFQLGIALSDKLARVPAERIEEGLRAALPGGAKVKAHESGAVATRLYEVSLAGGDALEALGALLEKGLLGGQIKIGFESCTLFCRADGVNAKVALGAETVERVGLRYTVRSESSEVQVQYPPADVHKRWLADDDYRAVYEGWRSARSDGKSGSWASGWPGGGSIDSSPPWITLKARDGKADEFALDLDEKVLLRFAFQGAEITIMRFNLKVLVNKVTGEYAVYRSLPVSLESIPKEIADRMAKEPERFKVVREPGKFAASFDLVRQAYEEAGGAWFQIEGPGGASDVAVPSSSEAVARPVPASVAATTPPSAPRPTTGKPITNPTLKAVLDKAAQLQKAGAAAAPPPAPEAPPADAPRPST